MPFHILSLSGGGIRGIFQACYLATVSKHFSKRLNQVFQMVAGTSTGSIVAFGVALGLEPERILELFRKHGPLIFPDSKRKAAKRILSWGRRGPRYSNQPLRTALEEVFEDRKLQDCSCEVVIPSCALDDFSIRTFSTIHNKVDRKLPVVDVVLASCAAPLYFPAVRMPEWTNERRTYVDGGLWANNPAFVAVMQASRHGKNIPFEEMRVVSVGNGEVPQHLDRDLFNNLRRYRMLEPVMDLIFGMQSMLADLSAAILVNGDQGDPQIDGEKNYLRINASTRSLIALDDTEAARKVLLGLAESAGRNTMDKFRRIAGIEE